MRLCGLAASVAGGWHGAAWVIKAAKYLHAFHTHIIESRRLVCVCVWGGGACSCSPADERCVTPAASARSGSGARANFDARFFSFSLLILPPASSATPKSSSNDSPTGPAGFAAGFCAPAVAGAGAAMAGLADLPVAAPGFCSCFCCCEGGLTTTGARSSSSSSSAAALLTARNFFSPRCLKAMLATLNVIAWDQACGPPQKCQVM